MPNLVARTCSLLFLLLGSCGLCDARFHPPSYRLQVTTPPFSSPSPGALSSLLPGNVAVPLQGATVGEALDASPGGFAPSPERIEEGKEFKQRHKERPARDTAVVAAVALARPSPTDMVSSLGQTSGVVVVQEASSHLADIPSSTPVVVGIEASEEVVSESIPVTTSAAQSLKEAILGNDIAGASTLLAIVDDVHELAKGLKFSASEREEFLVKSKSRMSDGDVITMKAIARSALDGKLAKKLATVMVLATVNERHEELETSLGVLLSDKELMHAILFADPAKQFLSKDRARKKAGKSQKSDNQSQIQPDGFVNSFVCGHCWPIDICNNFSRC